MSTESTPLTESGATATPPKTLIAKIITALAIFGAVVQLGESTLAATHHVQRVQFSRLVADFYAFFGAIGVIGIQLNPSNALKKFLLSNFTFLSTPIGIGLFYAFAGSFELTRVSGGSVHQ